MSSPVVFALTLHQARALDAVTRPGFKRYSYSRELESLRRRYLVQDHASGYRLTTPGAIAQELVRVLKLHVDGAGQG